MKANYCLSKQRSREKADCTVLAFQFCLGLSYEAAHSLMASFGRKPRKRISRVGWRKAVVAVGLEQRPDLSRMTLMRALEGMQSGRFVVQMSGHVFAVVDGRIFDAGFPKRGLIVNTVYQAPRDNDAFLARQPWLEKLARLEKLPSVWSKHCENYAAQQRGN